MLRKDLLDEYLTLLKLPWTWEDGRQPRADAIRELLTEEEHGFVLWWLRTRPDLKGRSGLVVLFPHQ
jgi:hypothetical protein